MDQAADLIADIARRVGDGTGFWFVFGSYMTMMFAERLVYVFHNGPTWNEKDAWANVRSALFKEAVGALLTGALFITVYVFLYEHFRLWTIPFAWWGWVLGFLLNDLAYYSDHRLAHRTGFFWAIHTTHHSSPEMNLLVANRGTVLDLGGLMSPCYLVLPILGLNPAMFLACKFFANLWGIFNHTRLVKRMGVLEGVLATPANHRVHHGTEPKYLDKNYGQVLIIWDRLFGTWQPEEEEPTYGLVHQLDKHTLWNIQTSGAQWLWGRLKAAPTWRDRLLYLVKPPGWSHDGCHETTETIVAAAAGPALRSKAKPAASSSDPSRPVGAA
jgi:sterol desaturase/sphingolipid hydroxylase (fatty acid hydroxylase superfamily)